MTKKGHHCIDCNKEISYGHLRCKSCSHKGKLNINFGGLSENHCKNISKVKKGKKHTKQAKENMGKSHRGKKCPKHSKWMKGKNNPMFGKIAKHGKGACYKRIYMRSSWEIIYAKYLDKNNIKWKYESKTFDLGNTTYTPDFYIPKWDCYIEIKGWWRDDAKKKFNKFKEQYPNINIKIITKLEDLRK